jgi:hypothetical protein
MRQSTTNSQKPRYEGVALSSDGAWITYNSENLVWLPSEFRPICSAVLGTTIGIGVGSGKVYICKYKGQHNEAIDLYTRVFTSILAKLSADTASAQELEGRGTTKKGSSLSALDESGHSSRTIDAFDTRDAQNIPSSSGLKKTLAGIIILFCTHHFDCTNSPVTPPRLLQGLYSWIRFLARTNLSAGISRTVMR